MLQDIKVFQLRVCNSIGQFGLNWSEPRTISVAQVLVSISPFHNKKISNLFYVQICRHETTQQDSFNNEKERK